MLVLAAAAAAAAAGLLLIPQRCLAWVTEQANALPGSCNRRVLCKCSRTKRCFSLD
jgi:hypothetical protein